MIATTCFLLLFQSALLIHSGKEVTEKVLFSRINQGGSRTKQLLCCIGCMVSRAWHRLHGFPRLASVAWFPALGIGFFHLSHFPGVAEKTVLLIASL